MKQFVILLALFIGATSFVPGGGNKGGKHDPCNLEILSSTPFKEFPDKYYRMLTMNRSSKRFKVKYFASKENGKDVYTRFTEWRGKKNIVLLSSGTYINRDESKPDGLTIDNGKTANNTLSSTFHGLVVIYPSGDMQAFDIDNRYGKQEKVKVTDETKKVNEFDVNNALDKEDFIKFAEGASATVFQTHLLVLKDKYKISPPSNGSSTNTATRRFLACCKQGDSTYHVIIQVEPTLTLYEATVKAYEFLKYKDMDEVEFMINLDTGRQDVFQLYDYTVFDPAKNPQPEQCNKIVGRVDPKLAINLLVYYYE